MAQQETKISKIYTMSVVGGDDSVKQVNALNKAFDKLRDIKKQLNTELSQALLDKKTTQEIENLRKKIEDVNSQMKTLSSNRQQSQTDAKAQAQVEKILADIKLKEAQATKVQADADASRTKNMIAQEKELDRQIAQEEKKNKTTQQATGYYNRLKKELDDLYRLTKSAEKTDIISFGGNNFTYDQAIEKLKQLSAEEQSFRRQFQKDGTLVGEYTTGIVQAFRNVGLDDLIKNQIDRSKTQVNSLNQVFEQLKKEYNDIKASGSTAFEEVEKKMVTNRAETEKLEAQVKDLEAKYKSAGTAGDKMAASLKESVKGIGKQIATYAIGFFGFQAAMSEINKGIDDAKQIEGVEAAFHHLNDPNLLSNLREATKGTVSDLHLMEQAVQAKNFQIPLEQLSGLLDFARRRAKDTGQDVDYLVQSIILGIGRKSPLILDNLGISAVRLREKMKGLNEETQTVGDVAKAVGEIISEENAKMGADIDTNAERVAQNAAQWSNLREKLGTLLLPVLTTVGSVLLGIASILGAIPWPVTTALLTAFTGAIVSNYVATSIATKQGLIYSAYLTLQQIRTQAVAVATRLATAEIVLFNGAVKISPLGIFLTVLAAVGLGFTAFAAKVQETKTKFDALNDVNRQASKIFSEQTVELNKWYSVATSTNVTLSTKHTAIQKLIDQFPQYFGNLKAETATVADLKKGYDQLTESIRFSARVQASSKLAADKQGAANQVAALLGTVETELTVNKGKVPNIDILNKEKFSEDDRKLLLSVLPDADLNGDIKIQGISYDSKKIIDALEAERKRRQDIADKYNDLAATYENENEAKKKLAQERANQLLQDRVKSRDVTPKEVQQLIDETKASLDALKINDPKRRELQTKIDEYQKILDNLNPKKKETPYKGPKLSGENKDILAQVDTQTGLLLAEEKTRRLNNEIDEETYLKNILKINQDGIDKKLKLIKGSGIAENKLRADLKNEKLQDEQDTNDKLFKIEEDRINKDYDLEKQQLDNNLKSVDENFFSSEEQKIAAKTQYNLSLIQLEQSKYDKLIALDKKYSRDSKQLEQEKDNTVGGLQSSNANEAPGNFLRASTARGQRQLDAAYIQFQEAINKVYNDRSLTFDQQKAKLKSLSEEYAKQTAKINLDITKTQVQPFLVIQAMGLPLPNEAKELLKKYWEIINQQNQQSANDAAQKTAGKFSLKNFFKSIGIGSNTDGLTEDEKKAQRMNELYSQLANTVRNFYTTYFQLQQASIEKNLQEKESFIDKERNRQLEFAQSQEEQDAINKKFDQQRDALEKQASEKKRKLALQQVTIDYAVASMKAFSQFGWPLGLIPFGFLTGEYLLQRKLIQQQQFAGGGKVQPINLGNGLITSPSNIPQQSNGDSVVATVRPGEVILNEQQQRRLGGPAVFGAIGVPGFASGGGVLQRFADGGGVQPPVITVGNNGRLLFGMDALTQKNDNEELKAMIVQQSVQINQLMSAVSATDTKEVVVVATEVEAKNKARKKASKVGAI